jgi:hypothetical protein
MSKSVSMSKPRARATAVQAAARTLPAALEKRAQALAAAKRERLVQEGRDLIAVVREKTRVAAAAFYEMGQALVALAAPAMVEALGYESFDDLVERAIRLSRSYVAQLMHVAQSLRESQAMDLGYEKSFAVAAALRLPGAALTGSTLRLGAGAGARTLDVEASGAQVIEQAAVDARRARQPIGKRPKGRTTTPAERALCARLQTALHRGGAAGATVRAVATRPGRPADVVIRMSLEQLATLTSALPPVLKKR